ncbi:aspartic protease [Infundibulicybe gibba]|nr:aspartic protease [Infundibulicybe gibba]
MFRSSLTLLAALQFLANAVSANPVVIRGSPVTLPLSRRLNLTSVHNLLRHDQVRARNLRARAERKLNPRSNDAVINEQVDNQAVTYIASVGVGSPATTYELLVDTGSSNTWVGATQAYVKTSTSVQTANRVSVTYGSGSFSGTEFTDTVTIAPGLVIPGQSIGVAATVTGQLIGPTDLTLGTLSPATGSLIPTVTDNLARLGIISANQIGISFEPTTSIESLNGEITWGGTDSSKFTGTIAFQPLTTTAPASEFWGINQSIRYGSTTIQPLSAGIVDTGTTLFLIASNAFTRYRQLTGAVPDANTGLLRVTSAQFANLQSLFLVMSTTTLELTADAQIWPRALNTAIGGVAGDIYLIVGNLGTPSGEGFDFVDGFAFLERFYSVFDTAGKRVGFATTPSTTSNIN